MFDKRVSESCCTHSVDVLVNSMRAVGFVVLIESLPSLVVTTRTSQPHVTMIILRLIAFVDKVLLAIDQLLND